MICDSWTTISALPSSLPLLPLPCLSAPAPSNVSCLLGTCCKMLTTANGETGEESRSGLDGKSRGSSEERRAGGDRREEGHEAARAGGNRAQEEESSPLGTLNEGAHRVRPRPSPTPVSRDRPRPPARARSPAHHANDATCTSASPSQPSLSPTSPPLNHPHPRMLPISLLPILYCPLCSPPAVLRAPVTLRCGHSFCASHLCPQNASSSSFSRSSVPPALPQCPLPTCSSSARSPHAFSQAPPVDVTTNKIIDLLVNASRLPNSPSPPPSFHDDPDDCTDTEYDVDSDSDLEYLPLPPTNPASLSPPTEDSDRACLIPRASSPPLSHHHRSRSPSTSSPQLRPRKRRRRQHRRNSPPQPRGRSHRSDHDRHALFEKELLSELTCEICFGLYWQPVTTPCQHTFCSRCLFRSLDHGQNCPLCRQTLPGYDYFQQHPNNKVILAIILEAFPDAYEERGAAVEAEERDALLDTPVFVCQLSFPGMPTMLHFFEPRYRLMLRRCLESPSRCFGMIPPPRAAPSISSNGRSSTGNEYGTMLYIRNVQMLPDGRSLVECWGTWRFRIMARGMRDGYMVARVERIEDYEEELDPNAATPVEDPLQANSGQVVETTIAMGAPGRASRRRSEAQSTADSRAEAERAGDQLEEAVRAELGDVFMPVVVRQDGPTSVASSSTSSGLLSSSPPRSTAAARAIEPLPSSSAATGDRNVQRPQQDPSSISSRPTEEKRQQADRVGGEAAPRRAPTNAELMAKCHAFIEQTRQGTPWVVQHLHNNYVPMPSDPASFSFWMALLLPIDEHEKAKLLPIRSPRLRLRLVVHWIEQLNSQWAHAYAHASALQVVLWRVRYFLMLPRGVRIWVMFFAYAALLAAVYLGQSVSDRVNGPVVEGSAGSGSGGEL